MTRQQNIHLIGFLFLLAGSMAYAAEQSGSVQFPVPVRIGGNNLPAGKYALHWEAGSPEVQLKISGQGKTLSVPATVSATPDRDELLMHREGEAQVVEGFTTRAMSFKLK